MMLISQHARTRMEQRAIPAGVLAILFDYGCYQHDGQGAEIVHFPREVKSSLRFNHFHDFTGSIERYKNIYAVISNGVLITVGHRYRRIEN